MNISNYLFEAVTILTENVKFLHNDIYRGHKESFIDFFAMENLGYL